MSDEGRTLTPALLASRWTDGGVGGTNGGGINRPSKNRKATKDSGTSDQVKSFQDAVAADCSRMSLNSIEDISHAINLSKLNLSGNLFTNSDSLEGLAHCVNLTWLNLAENRLEESCFHAFVNLAKLQVLNLSHNEIPRIPLVAQKLTSLKALILNNNSISRIDNISSLTNLNTLVLSNNNITEIPPLTTLTSLTKLSISHNKIRLIPPHITSNPNIRELRLSHNLILSIPQHITMLPALEILDIGGNLIKSIEDGVSPLSGLLRLVNLTLKGNPFVPVPSSDTADETTSVHQDLKEKVVVMLPSLRVLDGHRFDAKFLERREKRARDEELRKRRREIVEETRVSAKRAKIDQKKPTRTYSEGSKSLSEGEGEPHTIVGTSDRSTRKDKRNTKEESIDESGGTAYLEADPNDLDSTVRVRGSTLKGLGPRPPHLLGIEGNSTAGNMKDGRKGKQGSLVVRGHHERKQSRNQDLPLGRSQAKGFDGERDSGQSRNRIGTTPKRVNGSSDRNPAPYSTKIKKEPVPGSIATVGLSHAKPGADDFFLESFSDPKPPKKVSSNEVGKEEPIKQKVIKEKRKSSIVPAASAKKVPEQPTGEKKSSGFLSGGQSNMPVSSSLGDDDDDTPKEKFVVIETKGHKKTAIGGKKVVAKAFDPSKLLSGPSQSISSGWD